MNSSDTLIEKLRKENYEQFFTLVRMHLSFIVDINTDDVDCSTDKPKPFRWNFNKKSKGGPANSSQNNVKSGGEVSSATEDGITRAYELIDFLSKEENVTQEGIFRRTGSLTRQQELRQLLLSGSNLGLDEGKFSVHDCASVLKGFLAELPQPLLMDQYYQTYCTLAAQYPPSTEGSEPKLLTALQLLFLLLTPLHRNFLLRLLVLLRMAADNEASNRMSPDTLATMFTPHLVCPRKLSPEAFHTDCVTLSPLVSFMIRRANDLAESPASLVTDATAYFTARNTANNTRDLDESITDRTAAKTVYTFVDRGRSRATGACTETALAQLYAHIHALPHSAHRTKLIKQFNRQNGLGTPIQVQRTGKAAGSRSFGDSIKRHIFNKGLLNKTPKKGSGSSINQEKSYDRPSAPDDISHKNIVMKNFANKIASSESLDNEHYESDTSNESTLSEGALDRSKKISPKFVSEPNLSILDSRHDETPKNTKNRGTRLFRSKIVSSQNLNKRYQKKSTIKGTPTSCVSCFEDPDTGSENDGSCRDSNAETDLEDTPQKPKDLPAKMYLTSTPGISEAFFDEGSATPYTMKFRRASMSPITKSTQKLSKAMQESIMTPRSRKPLIVTSEQRDNLPQNENKQENTSQPQEAIFQSLSPNNDSDFVSSDDEKTSRLSQYSLDKDHSRSENTRFLLSSERPNLNNDLDASEALPKFKISEEVSVTKSLTEPFRDYLLSRSVLTATPVDLSILNKSNDDERLSDSLMYCLDGNMPSDLTSSIGNLVVDKSIRSPFKSINGRNSPNRKRISTKDDCSEIESKKALIEKENVIENFELRETDL